MHVHPDIAALRSDTASQRRVQSRMRSALEDWFALGETRAISRDLARYGAGEPFETCPHLGALLSDLAAAMPLVNSWQRCILDALAEEPLGEVPHQHSSSLNLSNIRLAERGRAGLNILAYEQRGEAEQPTPRTALFADRECHELVLAGSAAGFFHRRSFGRGVASAIETEIACWEAGSAIELTGPDQSRQILKVEGTMVILQLSRTPKRPGPSQEYRLSDGALLQSASGDKSASQRLMALAVLGAAQCSSALPVMKAKALDQSEDADVRWEAVRQALTIDAARGIELLALLRRSDTDRLAGPACDLMDSLIAANPSLSQFAKEEA